MTTPSPESIDLSREPLAASFLSMEQKERLSEILDRYLSSLEEGVPIHPEALVNEHPDLAEPLQSYLRSLDELHCAAAGFGGSTKDESADETEVAGDTRRLGDFMLGRELGRGGMGIVYEARQISLDRTVALKVLPFAAVLDAKQIARFKSEAQAAAQILHPNIVPVFAIGVDRGVHFYAMQFIDGQPLDVAIAGLRNLKRRRKHAFESNSLVVDLLCLHSREATACNSPGLQAGESNTKVFRSPEGGETRERGQPVSPPSGPKFSIPPFPGLKPRAIVFGTRDVQLQNMLASDSDWRRDGLRGPRLAPSAHSEIDNTCDRRSEPTTTSTSLLSSTSDNAPEYFRTVARLGVQASEALHAAHEYGIVHRDIKPSNLLLDFEGKLWVTDFGLARCQRDTTLSKTGDIVGTMRYMSPEQATGQTSLIDQRTDIYSLGVTLYELLALEPAVPGTDGPALLRNIDQHNPRALRKLRPKLPADLENVILKAMARDREGRYMTAKDFADDLRRFLSGQPTIAKPPTVMERATKWALRHKQVVTAGVCVALLACVGFALSTILISREKLNTENNYERAERNFRDAREAVDRFGSQFAERLANVPGAGSVRHEMLRETLAYYQRFVEQATHDPSLQAELAMTYSKIGTLAEDISSTEEAIAAHEKAIALFTRLATTEPHLLDHQRHLATCRNNMAMSLRRAGRILDAQNAYQSAIDLQSKLAAQTRSQEHLGDLAISHTNLGLLWAETGSSQRAEQAFQEAIRLQLELLARSPDDAAQHHNLAATFNNLSAIYIESKSERAIESYESALEHQQFAVDSQPDNTGYLRALAATHNNLGSLHSTQQDYTAAAASYEQAIQLQQALLAADPSRRSYRQDLAISLNNFGLMQSRLRKSLDAEQAFERAAEIHRTTVASHPDDMALRNSFGGIYNNLGIVLEEQGRFEDAATAYVHAVEQQRVAYMRAPRVRRYRIFLSKHYFNFGRVLRLLGEPDRAARVAVARRELWPADGDRLFSVAEELALSSRDLRHSPGAGEVTATQATSMTLDTLEQAIEAGFQLPRDLVTHETFSDFKDNQRFLQLVSR